MSNQKLFQPSVDDLEVNANVVVTFHGLMCFAHKATALVPFCEVGIHNDASGHTFSITVWEVDLGFDPPDKFDVSDSRKIASFKRTDTGSGPDNIVSLTVTNPRIAGVSYFQPEAVPVSINDFRRVPDFESRDFYDQRITGKKRDKFGPRVHIYNGIFYAGLLTQKKFKRHDGGKRLGRIGHLDAANIYLNVGGSAVLQVDGKSPVQMPYRADKRYLVMVENGCPPCNTIDFDEYYNTFTPPTGKPQYHLVLDESSAARKHMGEKKEDEAAEDAKKAFKKFLEKEGEKFSDDDAPCGAGAFGLSDGIG